VKDLIFFDGVCAMCHWLVQFVLDRDPTGVFRFAPLQSVLATEVLSRHGRDPRDLDTLYVVVDRGAPTERLLRKGRAALYVLRRLESPWRAAIVFGVLPTFLLDLAYDGIARVRYRLFGRYDTCRIPTAQDRERFLER
jgi:predicted DCC family thiol-disulfide oxidoreductase YuxK